MTTAVHIFSIYERRRRHSSRNDADNPRNVVQISDRQKAKIGTSLSFALFIMIVSRDFFYGIHIGVVLCVLLVICMLLWGLITLCETLIYYFCNPSVVREQLSTSTQLVGISITENPSDIPPPYDMVVTLSPNNNRQFLNMLESPPPSYDNVS